MNITPSDVIGYGKYVDINISTVNIKKSILIVDFKAENYSSDKNEPFCTFELMANKIRITNVGNGVTYSLAISISWQVVEFY